MVITALLMALSYWIGNVAILEQPLTSTMPRCQPLRSVFEFVKVTRVVTWHGAFGAKSKKPLQILSSHSMIECLKRPKPSGKSSTLARPGEAGTFTGKKAEPAAIAGLHAALWEGSCRDDPCEPSLSESGSDVVFAVRLS